MELPDQVKSTRQLCWFDKLDEASKADVIQFLEAFESGKLNRKLPNLRSAARWLSAELGNQKGVTVKYKTIEDWMRLRRQT
jgi:hypothetical protein